MDKAKVLEKVRKCLALGQNEGASEAERARALAQAGKLLASINLTMAAVSEVVEDRVRHEHELTPAMREWPRGAMNGIARLFFCKYYREHGTAKFYYIGKSVNVLTVQMMVEYVLVNIVKEAKKRASAAKAAEMLLGRANDGTGYGATWEYAFCLGASEAVRTKCEELIKQREAEGIQGEEGSGTALMVIDLAKQEMAKNMALLKAMGINLVPSSIRQARDGAAYHAGAKHGQTINLSRQVGSSGGQKLLGGK